MQDRFIELTTDDGTLITLNVAHITAIGSDREATHIVAGRVTEYADKVFVSTSARQVFYVQEDYEYISSIVRRAHL